MHNKNACLEKKKKTKRRLVYYLTIPFTLYALLLFAYSNKENELNLPYYYHHYYYFYGIVRLDFFFKANLI